MAIISSGIYPINPNVTDGTQLAAYINELVTAINSNQASVTRPPLVSKGGIWSKLIGDNEVALMIYDGAVDNQVATVVDGIINIEGVGTGGNPLLVAGDAIYLNANTINEDYAIPDGFNGMSAGEMTVNATVDVGNGTWTIVGEGGGEPVTLDSLGIPHHDKVTVNNNGNVTIGHENLENIANKNEGALVVNDMVNGGRYAVAIRNHNLSTPSYLRIGRGGSGDDTAMSICNNWHRNDGYKADDPNFGISSIAFGHVGSVTIQTSPAGTTSPTTRMAIDQDGRVDINGSLYVNGTPKSLEVMLSDVETKLADRDKIIDKLLAKVEALEEKLKKVK